VDQIENNNKITVVFWIELQGIYLSIHHSDLMTEW
jgi:hypothetical protein